MCKQEWGQAALVACLFCRGDEMFSDILNKIIKYAMVSVLSIITVMVSTEVVLRYCFGKTLYITEEFTRYMMVWMVFLGAALAIKENAHNRVEIFLVRFPGKSRYLMGLIGQLAFALFLVVLVIQGCSVLPMQFDQIIPTLDISMFWFYLALPVGGVLMIINLIPKIWESILILMGKREPVEEVEEIPVIDGGLS